MFSSSRTKCRCRVRSSGDQPLCARRIAAICTAVRAGTSRFSAAANSNTCPGVRGCTRRGLGTSASNPPRRQSRIHRSIVGRATRTGVPNGPGCARPASSRTNRPRCLVDKAGSAASRISPYRNNPIARARSARTCSSLSWPPAITPSSALDEHTRVARVLDQQPLSKGQFVLIGSQARAGDSIRPPVTPAAACHADTAPTTPSRRRTADPNDPTTSTASANAPPCTGGGPVNGSTCTSNPTSTARTPAAFRPNTRSHPRTVEAGRPNAAATGR